VLLTFCALLSAFRYSRSRTAVWAAVTGLCLGLMCATKETVVIVCACMLAAGLLLMAVKKAAGETTLRIIPGRHLVLAAAAGVLIAVAFFSSFLSHPAGIVDSVLAYRSYLWRGTGHETWHVHPWHYYSISCFISGIRGSGLDGRRDCRTGRGGGVAAFRKTGRTCTRMCRAFWRFLRC